MPGEAHEDTEDCYEEVDAGDAGLFLDHRVAVKDEYTASALASFGMSTLYRPGEY
jgi:hypothetical protein